MQKAEADLEFGVEAPTVDEAPSPFLPGTHIQYAIDSTSIGWMKTCPRLYYYNMILGYRPKEESIHLRFGIEYHKALEQYDMGRANAQTHEEAQHIVVYELMQRLADYEDPPEGAKASARVKTKENLVRSVVWYLENFKDDPAKTYIKTDGKPAVEQSFRFELGFAPRLQPVGEGLTGAQPYLLCGHLDRVVTFNDELFVMDRKTTTTTPSEYYFNQYEPNNQMTLYTLAGQIILKSPVKGVIIDVAQVAVGFSRFVRGITYRSPDQIEEWLEDLKHHLAAMENYATEGYWPQNDTACDKFGGCRFREVCSRSPAVRRVFLESDFTREEPWNPLVVR